MSSTGAGAAAAPSFQPTLKGTQHLVETKGFLFVLLAARRLTVAPD